MTKTEYYLALIVASLALTACGKSGEVNTGTDQQAPADAAADGSLEQGLAEIGRDRLESHVVFLADDARQGRMTGTPEYDESAAYVASQFEEIGLEARPALVGVVPA